jgi:hypothetical protein
MKYLVVVPEFNSINRRVAFPVIETQIIQTTYISGTMKLTSHKLQFGGASNVHSLVKFKFNWRPFITVNSMIGRQEFNSFRNGVFNSEVRSVRIQLIGISIPLNIHSLLIDLQVLSAF